MSTLVDGLSELYQRIAAVAQEQVAGQHDVGFVLEAFEMLWGNLKEHELKALAWEGMRSLVADARMQLRQVPPQPLVSAPVITTSHLRDLHARVECPFTSHTTREKMKSCLGDLLTLPLEEQVAEISCRVMRNRESQAKFDASAAEHTRRIQDCLTEGLQAAERRGALRVLESINLVGADGKAKTLAEFDAADLSLWLGNSERQVDAWEQRLSWFSSVLADVQAEDARVVGELSNSALQAASVRAAQVWHDMSKVGTS